MQAVQTDSKLDMLIEQPIQAIQEYYLAKSTDAESKQVDHHKLTDTVNGENDSFTQHVE
jgi:hypothetical protein